MTDRPEGPARAGANAPDSPVHIVFEQKSNEKAGSKLDKSAKWGQILTPVVLAVIGYYVNSSIKGQEVSVEYVRLAVDILNENPTDDRKLIREWATKIIDDLSPVRLGEATNELLNAPFLSRNPVVLENLSVLLPSIEETEITVFCIPMGPDRPQLHGLGLTSRAYSSESAQKNSWVLSEEYTAGGALGTNAWKQIATGPVDHCRIKFDESTSTKKLRLTGEVRNDSEISQFILFTVHFTPSESTAHEEGEFKTQSMLHLGPKESQPIEAIIEITLDRHPVEVR